MKLAVSGLGNSTTSAIGHVLGIQRDAVAEDEQQHQRQEKGDGQAARVAQDLVELLAEQAAQADAAAAARGASGAFGGSSGEFIGFSVRCCMERLQCGELALHLERIFQHLSSASSARSAMFIVVVADTARQAP